MRGMLPIRVPGVVDGWFELRAKNGRLPMQTVLASEVRDAREGFPVTQLIGLLLVGQQRARRPRQ